MPKRHPQPRSTRPQPPAKLKKLHHDQLYQFDYERAEKFRTVKESEHVQEYDEAREAVEGQYSKLQDSKLRRGNEEAKINQALHQWFIQYTDNNFPSMGKISYCIPHFHIGIVALERDQDTLAYDGKQESELRGENAQRKVGQALMLLSNKMEENGEDTMFIMSNVNYENVLKGLTDKPKKLGKPVKEEPMELGGKLVKDAVKFDPVECDRKEADLIVLHKQKGVIFVQVKSYGTYKDKEGKKKGKDTGVSKREAVLKQLLNDENNFKRLMEPEPKSEPVPQVHKVWAWPNLTAKEVEQKCKIQDIKVGERPTMLSRDDLFEDSHEVAESEYDLGNIRKWWKNLPDRPISEEIMKVIIGKYIGTFSRPLDTNFTTERSHVRTVCESVALSTKLTKSLCLKKPSQDDKKTVASKDKRVHLQGPPGSGRTTKLILQAVKFLTSGSSGSSRQVLVVDTCRGNLTYKGSLGKPVCSQIVEAVKNAEDKKYINSVHHLPLNLHENITADKFKQKVLDILGKTSNENILFIVDEILPKEKWGGILNAFQVSFKSSQVWCADGIISQQLSSEFKLLELSGIHRIPPSVQKVLRFTDWDQGRVEKYISDAGEILETQILSTNGPTPISIRHEKHIPRQPVMDCILCAEELERSLISMKIVRKCVEPEGASSQAPSGSAEVLSSQAPSGSAEGASSQAPSGSTQSSKFLPCSIAILFGLPENGGMNPAGTETKDIEIPESTVSLYTAKMKECPFIKKLQERLEALKVTFIDPFEKNGQGLDELWDDIVVSSTDSFMGLERDVIIYLPGDLSHTGAPGPSRPPESEQPRMTRSRDRCQSPSGSGTEASTSSHVSVSKTSVPKPSRKIPMPGFGKESEGLARCYWRKEDIDHYTDWDKSNVMCAASRCSGQLILLIP